MEWKICLASQSELLATLSVFDKPAKRPPELPLEVLWTMEDLKNDEEAAPTQANQSRPPMRRALRNIDGTMIDDDAYDTIHTKVDVIFKANLLRLTPKNATRPLTRTQLRSSHREAWFAVIRELEEQCPVVGLCARHWKAEQLLGQHINSLSNTTGRRVKRANAAAQQQAAPNSPAME
ncbi:hypothetical protein NMY22_g16507 [Coprinellus aureogranulatus]|nr:hypothetical protein NMY22_g16507 [Coprinellus aureogranulatus]